MRARVDLTEKSKGTTSRTKTNSNRLPFWRSDAKRIRSSLACKEILIGVYRTDIMIRQFPTMLSKLCFRIELGNKVPISGHMILLVKSSDGIVLSEIIQPKFSITEPHDVPRILALHVRNVVLGVAGRGDVLLEINEEPKVIGFFRTQI